MCEKMKEQRINVFNTTHFIMVFTHCNVHDSVLLSNKEDTQHKENIYHFII